MLRLFLLCLFSFLSASPLFSSEELSIPPDEPFVSSLVKTQNLLSTTVKSVSTISGEWLHSETDFVILGPEPLVLNRYYMGGDGTHSEKLGYHWDFNRSQPLIMDLKRKGTRHVRARARLHQSSGISTIHEAVPSSGKIKSEVVQLRLSKTQGLTNCLGEMSGRSNLHNTVLMLDQNESNCTAISGSNQTTVYKFSHTHNFSQWKPADRGIGHYEERRLDFYDPVYEKKPNGNTFHFSRSGISVTNASRSLEFGHLKFSHESSNKLRITASDGKTALYTYKTYRHVIKDSDQILVHFKSPFSLSEVSFSHKPTETYEYMHGPPQETTDKPVKPLLKAKRLPNGRYQEVEYYTLGLNQLSFDGRKEDYPAVLMKEEDYRLHRVKLIKEPAGHDAQPIITHRFVYEADKLGRKKDQEYSGKTIVYDAYLRKTIFEYNNKHRPTKIKRYCKKLYSEECYTWDGDIHFDDNSDGKTQTFEELFEGYDSQDIEKFFNLNKFGNLIGKYFKDAEGNIPYAHFFDYDFKGNITKDSFFGNLTGTNKGVITFGPTQRPVKDQVECYEKRFTYSQDGYNLLLTEEEDNGKGIICDYYPGSDLIAAKYVTQQGRIALRQFFHYDDNATLIKILRDDGSEKGEANLKGATERHITYFTPTTAPPLGLHEWVEEKCVDLESQEEISLKKVFSLYSMEGHLLQQDHYDANGQFCYSIYKDYDAHGNVIRETNPLGHEVIKEYDENDNLICERGPRPGDVKHYHYDYADRLTSIHQEADGTQWVTQYRYDLVGNRTAQIDRYGNETSYQYDELNRLTATTYPPINKTGARPETHIDYDILDNRIKETDELGNATAKTYNSRGKVTSILHPDGQLEAFEYAKDGALVKKVASNGTFTHYTVDCFGRILEERCFSKGGDFLYQTSNTYNGFHKTSSTDKAGLTTCYEYDKAGRLIKSSALDKIESHEYDPLGRITKTKEPYQGNKEKITCYEYDFLNRVTQERIEDNQGLILHKVSYVYDLLGNRCQVIEETEAGPSRYITHYNIDKKPLKTIDPEGNETNISYQYDAVNPLGQFVLQTTTTDPLGRQVIITHDSQERPVHIQRKDLFGLLLASQELVYDLKGNVLCLIDHVIVDGKEVRAIEAHFAYQKTGQVIQMTLAKGLPEQQITYMTYNSHGEKESTGKGDGTVLKYTYDSLGRVASYTSSSAPEQSFSYRYTYNQRNQPLKVEDLLKKSASEFVYDQRGRLLSEKLTTDIVVSYEYDALDRVLALILPDFSRVEYDYDAAHLQQVNRYQDQKLIYTHYYESHDQAGLNLKALSINGQTTYQSYDSLKRPLGRENPGFKQLNASYDKGGRLLQYELQDPVGSLKAVFGYDSNDHLIFEESHCKETYACDSLHNRLSKNQLACRSNGLHQLISNGEHLFTYDQAGNLTKKKNDKETITYLYDAADRLISVKGAKETSYQYDSFNRRVSKIEGGKTTRYLYAGQDEIGSIDESGNIQELRVLGKGHGAETGASIAIELQGKIYAPIHDFRGNIVCLTDLAGTPVETYRYSAFGETTIFNSDGEKTPSSAIGNPWQYSSKRFDPESGFYNFGRRYYDPANGRWITADPAGLGDGPNLYAYLHHHPTYAIDLYGLEEEPYYPLAGVDHHDHTENQMVSENENQESPIGLLEKLKDKKDRLFFCGFSQLAELGIGFTNGIMNNLSEAYASAKALSEMGSDHFVTFVHNKSTGFMGSDLVRCLFELYFYMKTEAVQNQMDSFKAYFASAGPKAMYFHECHSEGAIVTRNALMRLPDEIRKRIIVLAIAPGAYIDEKYCYQVTHAVSTRDIVPLLDFVGSYRCRETTIRLKPHPDAPLLDHPIDSPTYTRFRQQRLSNYIKQYGGY